MLTIATPESMADVLYEGYLAPGAVRGTTKKSQVQQEVEMDEQGRPYVKIGRPQSYNLTEWFLHEGKKLPTIIAMEQGQARFFLVQMACSFLPRYDTNIQVIWARLDVDMVPHNPSAPPPDIIDLHPQQVKDQKQIDIHVRLSPMLKFNEAEVSLGEAIADIRYRELIPVITSTGALSNSLSWDMRATANYPLSGDRWFYAVVKVPLQANGVQARLKLAADVAASGGPRRMRLGKAGSVRHSDLSCLICI